MARSPRTDIPQIDWDQCVTHIPPSLAGSLLAQLSDYQAAAEAARARMPRQADIRRILAGVFAMSPFVAQTCTRHPALLPDLLASGDLYSDYADASHAAHVAAALTKVSDDDHLASALRRLRTREMVRIAWRDLAGWAGLEETLRDLSNLADACVDGALQCLHAWQCRECGTPVDRDGRPIGLVVLGMGKLGAYELNFSSDIDLIFTFPENGETRGRRRLSHQEFFDRLGRRLIEALAAPTADGFVYRVDMRLRPYGDSGPLTMNFDAVEEYYQLQGRGWERYAMIKARVIAGDREDGETLMNMLRPFVYRRYLDYGAFASLREMKALISTEVERQGLENNIKLGLGGIREVEFIGQAFQLIRGGREQTLQERGILTVLSQLAALDHLPAYAARELTEAYVFLRRLENRLQMRADEQTHELPEEVTERARLAFAMGYPDWDTLARHIGRQRRKVHGHFEQVFSAPQADDARDLPASDVDAVWRGALDGEAAAQVLVNVGFDNPEDVLRLLTGFRESFSYRALSAQGHERMDTLMPMLLRAVSTMERPARTFARIVDLIEAIARRTAYLALLVENPLALSQLIKLCAASPWIATRLTLHPVLLDELMDPRTLYAPLDRAGLEHELNAALRHVAAADLEQQMEVLRQFKQANVLRVAAADISGAMPLMIVSDHLTEIAEVILNRVLKLGLEHLIERHGRPQCIVDGARRDAAFCVIAYGKLGGIELGYGSDLDLVFLHDSIGEQQHTNGSKPLDNQVFFARLAQRMIHIMETHMPAGVLYEVDVRLRPSGASGLLVNTLEGFTEYLHSDAWTWEHQALVRARVVGGDAGLAERFATVRRTVLCAPRDAAVLQREVREMRERMCLELSTRRPDSFDLKQDRGGIADIEFMVQYGTLLWAKDHPELLVYTDNIRLLDGFAQTGLLPPEDCKLLADAYRAYRARLHRLVLQDEAGVVDDSEFVEFREGVIRVWQALMD